MKLRELLKLVQPGTLCVLKARNGAELLPCPDAIIPIKYQEAQVEKLAVERKADYLFQSPANWTVQLSVYLNE